MAKRRRGAREEAAHEGGAGRERWLVSYADMITLLFCLFLVMYAMSKLSEHKFQELSRSLSRAMAHSVEEPTPTPLESPLLSPSPEVNQQDVDNAMKRAEEEKREDAIMEEIAHRLGDVLAASGWRQAAHIHLEEAGLAVTLLTDGLLFDTGDAEVRPKGIPIILAIASAVRPFPNPIRVEGHTDNVPLRGGPYKTNWGLSTMRATNVAEILMKGGQIDPRRLSVLGYGDTRPKVPNTSAHNRQINRRVEILVLKGRNPWGGMR